ncbi:MAG TPA: YscO family type III secretion system apparatus protein [Candidatus Thiothrix moscowensis]|uniref:type III secretion system stalk subunit SctO n=1 Tax=unclassified Thiothrix TaxID=2636184 RepID=UPI0025DAC4DF|nr:MULTISPECIES: YscO family type III secretion system apparatus protein [unclassified Thiothrix]HRJ54047.1 YscO family type III secretion system apparatus protein [Candidatus Thiothrix moscowensis]HRJ94193.1 YscO family type III secretion system apparatus protein [Candidatus Thiothrix moscowensis]
MSLEKLQALRQRRMEQRFVELQATRHNLTNWQTELDKQATTLYQFQRWRLQQQESLFADLQSKPFATTSWHSYQETLEQLRLQEEHLRQELQKAQQAVTDAEKQVEQARQQSRAANLKLEKMKEIIIKQEAQPTPAESAQ